MYIQRSVQSGELTLRNSLKRQEPLNYDNALPDLSDSKSTGNDNGVSLGVVRFCIVLGGILFVVIITGIVTYIYRKKLLSSKPKKPPRTNTISYILDYYEHNYLEPEKDEKNEKNERDEKDDIIKIDISYINEPTLNEDVQPPVTTSQISAPMPNSSVSIYNKERANSLASNLASRAIENTYTTITPPVPALIPVNNNQLKATSSRSEMKTISNATSFDNIIPEMFDDSTDNISAAPIDINAKWFTYPIDSPTIPLTPSRVPKVTSDNSRPSLEEPEAVPNISEVYDRKSKRNLRIRIDTFDQFKLNEDKPSFTPVGTLTYDNNLNSESKEDEIKEDENNKFVEVDLNNTTQDEITSEKYKNFGAPIKSNQHKRNGNIFEYKLIRSRTVI